MMIMVQARIYHRGRRCQRCDGNGGTARERIVRVVAIHHLVSRRRDQSLMEELVIHYMRGQTWMIALRRGQDFKSCLRHAQPQ